MAEQARFVVGGVYRRNRAVGGVQFGMLHSAVQEASGRRHGRMSVGGETDMTVAESDMGGWELIAEPGTPLVAVGPMYVTEADLKKAVDERAADLTKALIDRLIEAEAKLVQLTARVRDMEPKPDNGESKPIRTVEDLKMRARA